MSNKPTGIDRGAQLHVISKLRDEISAPVALFALMAKSKATVAVRFAGGCSGMDVAMRNLLQTYVVSAFEIAGGFGGVAMSGGTLESCAPTVCQIPVALRAKFGCIAVSTTPRIGTMHLSDEAGLTITNDARIETRQDAAVIVQRNSSDDGAWDDDLAVYLSHLTELRNQGKWTVAVIAVNGGGVTKKEIIGALTRRIPVIVVNGTGRAADQFSTEFRALHFGPDFAALKELTNLKQIVHIAEFDDPETMAQGISKFNLAQTI